MPCVVACAQRTLADVACVGGDQRAQARGQLRAAPAQRCEPGVILRASPSDATNSSSSACRRSSDSMTGVRPFLELGALARPAQRVLQIVQVTIERLRERRGTSLRAPLGEQLRGDVARQRLQLPARDGEAEKVRGDLRQLMRLVDDDRIGAGQQIAEAFLLQHEIRHQQMMIDDDDVRGLRFAPRLDDVTAIERSDNPGRGSCRASR